MNHESSLDNLKKIADEIKNDKNAIENIETSIVESIYNDAEKISSKVTYKKGKVKDWDNFWDNILTSRIFSFPIMILLLGLVFWITIVGANYPSGLLADFFGWGQGHLVNFCLWIGLPFWLNNFLIEGVYLCLTSVISVMLPPMTIFFALFAILEDLGYLPRVAFNLDRLFKKAGVHGKQALTMSMGFGCNAAGVIACRIIESPRERLIAMLTNVFVPCNGRFPLLIALTGILVLMAGNGISGSFFATLIVLGMVIFGVMMTFIISWIFSKTILPGESSSCTLELPPYRKPQFGRVILSSLLNRTIFVLKRAVIVAIPAGIITWILANIKWGDLSLLAHFANFLDPVAKALGLDGYILLAFILALPANEIVLPILIMGYLSTTSMTEISSLQGLYQLFVVEHNWSWITIVCMMLFSLLHYPCGSTLLTIGKESGSFKWALVGALMPLGVACLVCFIVNQVAHLMGWV